MWTCKDDLEPGKISKLYKIYNIIIGNKLKKCQTMLNKVILERLELAYESILLEHIYFFFK